MAILSMNDLVTGLNSQQNLPWYKQATNVKSTGSTHSWWRVGGSPTLGAIPPTGSGEIPTKATVGALAFNNPGVSNTLYVGKTHFFSQTSTGIFILYDRLAHTSNIVGNIITLQTVNTLALTRNTGGEGNQLFLEVYTSTSSNAPTVTALYTNELGVGGRTATATLVASPSVGQLFPFYLESGDLGVQSAQSVQFSLATSAAGNLGITIAKPIAIMNYDTTTAGSDKDAIALGMPSIEPNACIALMALCTSGSTSYGANWGHFNFIEG